MESEQAVVTTAIETQTDLFAPLPEPKPFIPKKTGVDASTQMTPEDQPFDFDREVGHLSAPTLPARCHVSSLLDTGGCQLPLLRILQVAPLLDVVVHKTLEQSLLEVEQEQELSCIAEDLERLRAEQAQEAARVRAVEASTAQEFGQKEANMKKQRDRLARELVVRRKVASIRLMKQVWPEMAEDVFKGFEDRGRWCDPVTFDIRKNFLPWLFTEVSPHPDATYATPAPCVAHMAVANRPSVPGRLGAE